MLQLLRGARQAQGGTTLQAQDLDVKVQMEVEDTAFLAKKFQRSCLKLHQFDIFLIKFCLTTALG